MKFLVQRKTENKLNIQYYHHRPYFPSQMKWESFKRKYTTLGFLLVFFREKGFLSLILHYFFNFHGPSTQNLYIRKSGMKKDCTILSWLFFIAIPTIDSSVISFSDSDSGISSLSTGRTNIMIKISMLTLQKSIFTMYFTQDFFISKFYILYTVGSFWLNLLDIRFLEIRRAQKQNFWFKIRPGWLKKRNCL